MVRNREYSVMGSSPDRDTCRPGNMRLHDRVKKNTLMKQRRTACGGFDITCKSIKNLRTTSDRNCSKKQVVTPMTLLLEHCSYSTGNVEASLPLHSSPVSIQLEQWLKLPHLPGLVTIISLPMPLKSCHNSDLWTVALTFFPAL